MSGLLLNLIKNSDGADWALAATSALPSRLKFEGQSGVLSQPPHDTKMAQYWVLATSDR